MEETLTTPEQAWELVDQQAKLIWHTLDKPSREQWAKARKANKEGKLGIARIRSLCARYLPGAQIEPLIRVTLPLVQTA